MTIFFSEGDTLIVAAAGGAVVVVYPPRVQTDSLLSVASLVLRDDELRQLEQHIAERGLTT